MILYNMFRNRCKIASFTLESRIHIWSYFIPLYETFHCIRQCNNHHVHENDHDQNDGAYDDDDDDDGDDDDDDDDDYDCGHDDAAAADDDDGHDDNDHIMIMIMMMALVTVPSFEGLTAGFMVLLKGHTPALQYNIILQSNWFGLCQSSVVKPYDTKQCTMQNTKFTSTVGPRWNVWETFLTKQLYVAGNMHEPTHDTWHQHKASC